MKKLNKKKLIFGTLIFTVLAAMYIPILVIFIFSFTAGAVINFSDFEFTFQLYRDLINNDRIMEAVFNTLLIAAIAAFLATIIGTMACVGMMKMRRRSKGLMMGLNLTPMINATIVTGFSLVLLFVLLGIVNQGYIRLILAHTLVALPIVMLIVLPRMKSLDPNVFEAAQDLGATPSQAFFQVMVPLLMPAMIGAFLVGFTISVDEFIITNYNNAGVTTIPTLVYQGRRPMAAEFRALSSIVFFTVIMALIIVNIVISRKQKKSKRRI